MAVLAITFDLDDTLWETWPTIQRAEQQLQNWLLHHYPRIVKCFDLSQQQALRRQIVAQHPEIAHDPTALRKKTLAEVAHRAGYEQFDSEVAFAVFFNARNDVLFYEDTLPALEQLSMRYTLGALSNGNADINRTGLGHLLQFAINAIDAGAPKPQPAMFQAACQHLGLAPQSIVHVGDDPDNDVLGAARIGMRTVWINRSAQAWPYTGLVADAEITSLAELEALLQDWQAQ